MGLAELTKNAVHVLPEGGLEAKLALERPLRVKLGIDVTAPDIHLGYAYVLERMPAFQAEGHTVVLIVGDYTDRIGDPSGRSVERPVLPGEEIDANAKRIRGTGVHDHRPRAHRDPLQQRVARQALTTRRSSA